MRAPMSKVVKKILADETKSREFMALLLNGNRSNQNAVIEVDGKRYVIKNASAVSAK